MNLRRVATNMSPGDLAARIDHTLLRPDASAGEIRALCEEATSFAFVAVCLASSRVALAAEVLRGSRVAIAAVVGFPHGNTVSNAKACEARDAVRAGAGEIDMVANLGALRDEDWSAVRDDIRAVVDAAAGRPVKVILETAMLTREQKVAGAVLAREAGAAFVKTSTGFGPGGATVEDVRLLARVVGRTLGVKASGGIRTRVQALALLAAGATRLGTSSGVVIVSERGS